jgi:hypothetical protein
MLPQFGARGNLHLERRALAQCRLHPDAAAVHLDDLLGDGQPQTCAALGLGIGAVHLVELVKDPALMFGGDTRACVHHADGKVAVHRFRRHAYLSGVGEFDGVAHEIEEHLGQALLVAEANG